MTPVEFSGFRIGDGELGPKLFGSHGVFGSNQTAKNPPDGKRQDHGTNQTVAQTRRVR